MIAMEKDLTDKLELNLKNAVMFSICLVESKDITSIACLGIVAKFPSGNVMKEELIKLMRLSEKNRRQHIMDELRKEFIKLGIKFGNIVFVPIDGASSLIGKILDLCN